ALGIAATYYLFGHLMDSLTWPGAFLAAGLATAALTSAWLLTTTDRPSGPTLEQNSTPSPDSGQVAATWAASEMSGVILSDQTSPGLSGIVSLLRDRSLLLIAISYGAYGYFQYLFFYWIEFYFHEILSLSTETSRFYSTIAILAMGVGMVAGGFCSD